MSQQQVFQKQQEAQEPGLLTGKKVPVKRDKVHEPHDLLGNHGVLKTAGLPVIQAKLKISQPDDAYEQEADRVADAVMKMPDPQVQRQAAKDDEDEPIQMKPVAGQITPLVQRKGETEHKRDEDDEDEPIQMKNDGIRNSVIPSSLESKIRSLKGGGEPMSKSVRDFFEPRFGAEFSSVRIHSIPDTYRCARFIHAEAFTIGNDIVFAKERYQPGTKEGRNLLAHELTHVIQQKNRSNSLKVNCKQKKIQTFKNETIYGQILGPHLYDEIENGITKIDLSPRFGLSFWYRIYRVKKNTDIKQLYEDLNKLYGYGRFYQLTPKIANYLQTRLTPQPGIFTMLYPDSRSREPVKLTDLWKIPEGFATKHDVSRPEISSDFIERNEEAWALLAPTARGFLNDWSDWSIIGLQDFLDEINLESDRRVQDALTIVGNAIWALTAFIPVVGNISRGIVGVVSLTSSQLATIASITPGADLNSKRKKGIKDFNQKEISKIASKIEEKQYLNPILTTTLVKAQERGIQTQDRDKLLWEHMFDIPYSPKGGRRIAIKESTYKKLKESGKIQ